MHSTVISHENTNWPIPEVIVLFLYTPTAQGRVEGAWGRNNTGRAEDGEGTTGGRAGYGDGTARVERRVGTEHHSGEGTTQGRVKD